MKFVPSYLLFGLLCLVWLWGVSVDTRPVTAQVTTTPNLNDWLTLAATYVNPFLTPLATIGVPPLPSPGGATSAGATPTPVLPTTTITPTLTVEPTATPLPLPTVSPTPIPTLPPTASPTATVLPTIMPTATVPAGVTSTPLGWGITALAAGVVLLWIGFMAYLVWRSIHPARYR